VKLHPDADTLYVETVDLAEDRPRTVLSNLVDRVPMEKVLMALVGSCSLWFCAEV